jgi:hypothetical protein
MEVGPCTHADLLALDDDGSADYLIGCGNIEQQSLAFLGHRQD